MRLCVKTWARYLLKKQLQQQTKQQLKDFTTMKKDVEEFMMNNGLEGVGVYCGTYAKYNSGSLYGAWLDMEKFSDAEEFFEVCRLLHNDEKDPEFMFQDYTGFPESLYSESMNEKEAQAIIDYANVDEEEREMLEDFMDINCYDMSQYDDISDILEHARERCEGKWDSLDDFADHIADETISEFEAAANRSNEYMSSEARRMFKTAVDFLRENFNYESYRNRVRFDFSEGKHGWIFLDI